MAYAGTYYTGQEDPQIQVDALKVSNSAALPNAANTINTSAIDLEAGQPFPTTGKFTVQLATTQSTGANSLNINVALQHTNANTDGTADNGNWANITGLAIRTIAGNAANYPANTWNVTLPPSTKRYIRGSATGEANGGNASDGTLTVKLLF